MDESNLFAAFLLTFLAGMSTLIGGVLTFFVKKDSFKVLSLGLSFSAGVMIYISFMEIMPAAAEGLAKSMSEKNAAGICAILFFVGMLVAAMIDQLFPEHVSSGDLEDNCRINPKSPSCIKRMGIFTAIALTVHNIPEGLSVFVAGANSTTLGLSIAVAIALHNIPEGISVALPIYSATGSRKKAIFWSFLSGMAEPLGALLGLFALKIIAPEFALGIMLSLTAGIMVYLAIDELLPAAREYEDAHETIIGASAGMALMAVTLYLL